MDAYTTPDTFNPNGALQNSIHRDLNNFIHKYLRLSLCPQEYVDRAITCTTSPGTCVGLLVWDWSGQVRLPEVQVAGARGDIILCPGAKPINSPSSSL